MKALLLVALLLSSVVSPSSSSAQGRHAIFQSGEELVYKVKYGFVKLGTLVIKTGESAGTNKINARLQFWTAEVPFLDVHNQVIDVIDTHALCVLRFEEHSRDGDKKTNQVFDYNPGTETMTYSNDAIKDEIIPNVKPFNDALTLVFNMRAWAGSGQSYGFPMRSHEGERTVSCRFTHQISNESCPAVEDKELKTRVIEGQANMGDHAPLGANGKFTVYVTDDAAAIPVRIEMKIAVGSITLILDKVKRPGWQP